MAQRRMISKSISTSTKLADVSLFARLLFTWLVAHCDDYGRMDGSPKIVRGIVVPLGDEGIEEVESALKELEKVGLIERYDVNGKTYLQVEKWTDHQTLRSDRPLHAVYPKNPKGKPEGDSGIPEGAKRHSKGSEGKLSEVKIREELVGSLRYLSNVPTEDIAEFVKRFDITERKIRSVAEDLKLYCERKGKVYKNYKSFLLNAIKRDHRERPAPAAPKAPEKPLTEAQKKKNEETRQSIRDIAAGKTMKRT